MAEVKFQGHAVTPTSFRFIPISFHVNHIWSWKSFIGSHIESIHDDVIKWKHFPRYWPFVREIHRSPVNFPHKGQWRGALMFTLICARMNGWVNNREAGDLRRYRVHYDVIVMSNPFCFMSVGSSIPEIWLWHPEEARTWCTKSWSDNIRQTILNLIRCVDMQWIRLVLWKYCVKRTRFGPQTHGQTDGRTDGPTRWNQYTPLQLRWSEWHRKHNQSLSLRTPSFIKQSHRVLYLVAHSSAMLEPHDDVIKWKHFPRYWSFVRRIHRSPVNSPHKDQWRGALMFSLICARINGWVNNREAGDLRRHQAHCDVIVMRMTWNFWIL